MEPIYTVPEVAAYLKICKSKLYGMIRRGEFPHVRIGKNVRILESDLVEWLDKQHRPVRQMGFRFPE